VGAAATERHDMMIKIVMIFMISHGTRDERVGDTPP
jgi:hypothetical protein